ncbi:MAG TPA: hypothetical protein VN428_15735, partial [Bryobacteraceae bacterium]|nr:hypothetical protein [Bryobacteraceae bacterium]
SVYIQTDGTENRENQKPEKDRNRKKPGEKAGKNRGHSRKMRFALHFSSASARAERPAQQTGRIPVNHLCLLLHLPGYEFRNSGRVRSGAWHRLALS